MRLFIVLLCVVLVSCEYIPTPVPTHTFKAPFGNDVPNFKLGGDAQINVNTRDFIRLTPAIQSKKGYVYSETSVPVSSFTASISARVTGSGNIGGDGWAFWLTEQAPWDDVNDKLELFGGQRNFKGIMVVSDTFDNDNRGNNPYIAVFAGNGDGSFVPGTDGSNVEIGGCRVSYRNSVSYYTVRVTKIGDSLSVDYDMTGAGQWVGCVSVTRSNLLPGSAYYVGVTAETGGLADNHDIKSLEFFTMSPDAPAKPAEPVVQIPEKPAVDIPDKPVVPQPPVSPPVVEEDKPVLPPLESVPQPPVVLEQAGDTLEKLRMLLKELAQKQGVTDQQLDDATTKAREGKLKDYIKAAEYLESEMAQLNREVTTQADILETMMKPDKGGSQVQKLSSLLADLDSKTQEVMRGSFDSSRKDKAFSRDLGHEFEGLKKASQVSSSWTMIIFGLLIGVSVGCVVVWRQQKKSEMPWQ